MLLLAHSAIHGSNFAQLSYMFMLYLSMEKVTGSRMSASIATRLPFESNEKPSCFLFQINKNFVSGFIIRHNFCFSTKVRHRGFDAL
jgi:hypothetical protein